MKNQRHEIESVQDDNIEEILCRLPPKSLMRFKTVSKSWNDLISGSRFSKLHLKQSVDHCRNKLMSFHGCSTTLEYDASRIDDPTEEGDDVDISILAYCDGLFCFAVANDAVYLWNPSTKEPPRRIAASPIEFPPTCTHASVFFGLGYRSGTDDYELVRIAMFDDVHAFRTEVKAYSKNSGTWRRIGDFPYDYPSACPGVFVSGSLHWIVSTWENSVRRHRVASLNLTDESYGLIDLPQPVSNELLFELGSLEEKLVVFYASNDSTSSIWILQEHGTWTRIQIALDCVSSREAFVYFRPLCTVAPGKILVRLGAQRFATFDVDKRSRDDVCSTETVDFRIMSYVESIVSPYSTFN